MLLVLCQLLKLGLGGTGFASVHFRFTSRNATGKASATPILNLDAALVVEIAMRDYKDLTGTS